MVSALNCATSSLLNAFIRGYYAQFLKSRRSDNILNTNMQIFFCVHYFLLLLKPTNHLLCLVILQVRDPDSLSVVDWAGWKLPSSFTYNLNPYSVPNSVGGNNLVTIAANSFSSWNNAINNQLNIVRGSNTTISRRAF
jgi:hypothetical protein